MRIALIGAGISSALISLLLRRQFGPGIKLVVFDKARNIGGRMTTTYDNEDNPHCSVDTGAQYLTLTKSNGITTKYFQQLIDDHIIEPLDKTNTIGIRENADKIDYVASRGISSVIDFNAKNDRLIISTNEEQLDEVEAVIVTIPVPQILSHLKGSITQLIDQNQEVKNKLSQVKYSTRFAVGLFYPKSIINLNMPWRIYYVDKNDNEYLRFLAIDNAKRNKNEPPFSLIAHTSVEYGAKHTDDDKMIVGEEIKEKIFQFLPELPRETCNTKYHKWKYSQIIQSYPDKPGYILLNKEPLLLLAGDSFAKESNFEGCIEAAIETVKSIHALNS
ncbi:hypothetical protein I4U23_008181 [Adineta vaga]|nr:hypothetical protein I4U23_008181 [Adineta vaga]